MAAISEQNVCVGVVEDWPQNLRSTVAAHLAKGRVTSATAEAKAGVEEKTDFYSGFY